MRPTKVDGIIPAGAVIHGSVEFCGSLWVDAEIHGDVRAIGSASSLVIGPAAKIFGTVEAAQLTIYGAVTGRVRADGVLVFEHGARVVAEEIRHRGFTIVSGAHVEGTLVRPTQAMLNETSLKPSPNVQPLWGGHRRRPERIDPSSKASISPHR